MSNKITIHESAQVELYEEINPIKNSKIDIGEDAIVRIAPTAKIFNSQIVVPPRAQLFIEEGCIIEGSKVIMRESAIIEIGEYCSFIESTVRIIEDKAVFTIGGCSRINKRCNFFVSQKVALGKYCLLSADCLLTDSQIHSLDWQERKAEIDSWIKGEEYRPELRSIPLEIGDHCWIGRAAQVLVAKASSQDAALSIGSKTVIGGGAVVKESIPEKSLAVGVPAEVIRNL